MAFTIPNAVEVLDSRQTGIDQVDIDIEIAADRAVAEK